VSHSIRQQLADKLTETFGKPPQRSLYSAMKAAKERGRAKTAEHYKAQWDETKHPRDADGKFGSGGGSAGGGDEQAQWDETNHPRDAGGKLGPGDTGESVGARDDDADNIPDSLEGPACQNCDTLAPPPGGYAPDPAKGEAARVGVPGDAVPPPPGKESLRLPNLTPDEREAETKALEWAFDREGGIDKAAADYDYAIALGLGDGRKTFGTDDVKAMMPMWNKDNDTKAKYNTAVHQAANAVAKRAFLQKLDKLKPGQSVMITAGGVAAGKGYAIDNAPGIVASLQENAGAVWDTAGEQNSTELPWVMDECRKRGLKADAVFVHADPTATFDRVISRTKKKGRMVDARAYADSYAFGGKNFAKFVQDNQGQGDLNVHYFDNSQGAPRQVDSLPADASGYDADTIYDIAMKKLAEAPPEEASPAVKAGGAAGARIWGHPPAQSGKAAYSRGRSFNSARQPLRLVRRR